MHGGVAYAWITYQFDDLAPPILNNSYNAATIVSIIITMNKFKGMCISLYGTMNVKDKIFTKNTNFADHLHIDLFVKVHNMIMMIFNSVI